MSVLTGRILNQLAHIALAKLLAALDLVPEARVSTQVKVKNLFAFGFELGPVHHTSVCFANHIHVVLCYWLLEKWLIDFVCPTGPELLCGLFKHDQISFRVKNRSLLMISCVRLHSLESQLTPVKRAWTHR